MKVWVSKYPYCCLTPTPVIETPMADHQHGVGSPPWVFHQVVWVYDSNMGASTPTLSYNSPPMTAKVLSEFFGVSAQLIGRQECPTLSRVAPY